MKRVLSLVLALVLLVSLTSVTAFSATDPTKITSARITASSTTMRVGQMVFLELRIRPDTAVYDSVEWFTNDEDIIDLNEYGDVEGLQPGSAYVYARVIGKDAAGKTKRLTTAEIELTVTGRTSSSSSQKTSLDTDDAPKAGDAKLLGKIPAATVTDAVKKAVKKGGTTNAIFRSYESVSAATLTSAATAMKNAGGTVLLNFDTLNAAGTGVEGRVTLNPINAANVKSDIALGVYTNSDATGATRTKFEKYFKNTVVIIKSMQKGSYGMSATYAVKIGTALAKSKQLMLYSYDPVTNRYYTVNNSNIRIDTNGYVHFTTSLGDYLVISDGKLTLR